MIVSTVEIYEPIVSCITDCILMCIYICIVSEIVISRITYIVTLSNMQIPDFICSFYSNGYYSNIISNRFYIYQEINKKIIKNLYNKINFVNNIFWYGIGNLSKIKFTFT